MTFETNSLIIAFFGALIATLIGVIGFLTRGWWGNLLSESKAHSKQLDAIYDINQRQSIEIAKLGERMIGLDKRITDVEQRQHKLDNRLNTALLSIGIKMRKGELPPPDDEGGT